MFQKHAHFTKVIFLFSATGTYSVEYVIIQMQPLGKKESVTPVGHRNMLENSQCNYLFSAAQY